jgi:hypothetical protein
MCLCALGRFLAQARSAQRLRVQELRTAPGGAKRVGARCNWSGIVLQGSWRVGCADGSWRTFPLLLMPVRNQVWPVGLGFDDSGNVGCGGMFGIVGAR